MDPAIEERVHYWLEAGFDENTKQQVADLVKKKSKELVDAFYTNLAFGTGGLRGIMGVGSNRMNKYTVRWATQGLANYLKSQFKAEKKLRVAIGYDSRQNSRFFAEESARVLAGNGIQVFLFSQLRPTPLVSFACRYHMAQAAIMVTASHNPPSYNGYKVYWSDGAQVLPPHDTGIIDEVNKLRDPDLVQLAPLADPNISEMGEEEDEAYYKAIMSLQLWPEETGTHELKILYSPLHGTGITIVPEALRRFGFTQVAFVEEQKEPDGSFPTTSRPNPEEPQALKLGINKLIKEGHDLFIATDPDADRMGVVVRHQGRAQILSGNQIACIAAEYVCLARKENGAFPENAAFVKTIVTSELFRAIVTSHKATCFDVLTGFKYIAEKIREWEQTGTYHYLFGAEESYGCLLGTHVRDKDACIATCMMAEIALFAKKQKKTLVDLLDDLYRRYGVYREELISLDFEESKEGKERMQMMMHTFREKTPSDIAGIPVIRVEDLNKKKEAPNALPQADVLILELNDESKIVIRPSGTEPKVKIYLMVKEIDPTPSLDAAKKRADTKVTTLTTSIKKLARD